MKSVYLRSAILFAVMSGLLVSTVVRAVDNPAQTFNPSVSLILEGRYADYEEEGFELPGYVITGEAGVYDKGFSTGHNELILSANIDQNLYGFFNTAVVYEDGETIVELEEAFIETLGLGYGATLKAGQIYSGIGYLNNVHDHAHDFADVPLVYAGMFGNHLLETGVQARWLAPTDFFLEFGVEGTSGSSWPGGENEDNNSGRAAFVKTGGDIGSSASWQTGLSWHMATFDVREGGGHAHGDAANAVDLEFLDGKATTAGFDLVVKWAPGGNPKQTNFKFQAEYFHRTEEGRLTYDDTANSGSADYEGILSGYYVQAVYQFMPRWRVGLRYDQLLSDNTLSNADAAGLTADELGEATELLTEHKPTRSTVMLDFSPSETSRARLQYAKDDAGEDTEQRIYFQYIVSLGTHGAHAY